MTVHVGVVGAGAHSTRQHGPALEHCVNERHNADDSTVDLAAICDRDPERAAAYADEFGFRATYTDADRLYAEEDLDAVLVISPTDVTRDLAGDALARGVPTLVEKPPGRTVKEARELRDIATEHDTPHQVSFNRRFNPAIKRAQEFLNGRDPPRQVTARLHRVNRLEDRHVFDTGSHAIDLVVFLLSPPERVTSHRWRSREAGGEACEALIECADGNAALLSIAPDSGTHEETYEVVGPGYTLWIDAADPRVEGFVDGECRLAWTIDKAAPIYECVGALAETRAFLDAAAGRHEFMPDLEEALVTARAVRAVERGGRYDC
jgi:predicted dehydrogenase